VNVPDSCTLRHSVPEFTAFIGLAQQIFDIERESCHGDFIAVAGPALTGTVRIYLDPVTIGVGKIQCLAYRVVRSPLERPAHVSEVSEHQAEVSSARQEKGCVIESGSAHRLATRSRVFNELDEWSRSIGRTHRCRALGALHDVQPQNSSIEIQGAAK
jgi:hypothetical protein